MDTSSSVESSLDYIHLIPYDSYPFEKARHRTTIKWLLQKAYAGRSVPEEIAEPFYEDDEGLPHLKPPIVNGLADAELYTNALCNLYSDPNYSQLSPWGVVQLLGRKGVFIQQAEGIAITETILIQNTPLRIGPHLALIEGLQQLFIKEAMKWIRASPRSIKSIRELPSDNEEALLLWINQVVLAVKVFLQAPISPAHTSHYVLNKSATPPRLSPTTLNQWLSLQPYQDLSDLSDGVGLATLIAFYAPNKLQLTSIITPTPGEPLNVSEALTNLQLFQNSHHNCYLAYEDLLYIHKSMRLNLVCLLVELMKEFEGNQGQGNLLGENNNNRTGSSGLVEKSKCQVSPMARSPLEEKQQQFDSKSLHSTPIKRERKNLHTTIDAARASLSPPPLVVVPLQRQDTSNSGGSIKSSSKSSNTIGGQYSVIGGGGSGGNGTGSFFQDRHFPQQQDLGAPPLQRSSSRDRHGFPRQDSRDGQNYYSSRGQKSSDSSSDASTTSNPPAPPRQNDFIVKSRRAPPTLNSMRHAAGLPSGGGTNLNQESSMLPGTAGGRRLSRSNSLTEIDSQLTIENFGGSSTVYAQRHHQNQSQNNSDAENKGGGGDNLYSVRVRSSRDPELRAASAATSRDSTMERGRPVIRDLQAPSRDNHLSNATMSAARGGGGSEAASNFMSNSPQQQYHSSSSRDNSLTRDSSLTRDYSNSPRDHIPQQQYYAGGAPRDFQLSRDQQYSHSSPAREYSSRESSLSRDTSISPQRHIPHQQQYLPGDAPRDQQYSIPARDLYSTPRDAQQQQQYSSSPRDSQQYSSPGRSGADTSQTYLSNMDNFNQPINIVYLGSNNNQRAYEAAAEQEIEETSAEIDNLRAKLEEKRLAIEKLRMRRVMGSHGHGSSAGAAQGGGTPPAAMSNSGPAKLGRIFNGGDEPSPIQQPSFHLHSPEPQPSSATVEQLATQVASLALEPLQQHHPIPPPRTKRLAKEEPPSMEPQSISFIQEPKISSGTKTYRIQTPDTSLSSGGGQGSGTWGVAGRPAAFSVFTASGQQQQQQQVSSLQKKQAEGFYIDLDGGNGSGQGSSIGGPPSNLPMGHHPPPRWAMQEPLDPSDPIINERQVEPIDFQPRLLQQQQQAPGLSSSPQMALHAPHQPRPPTPEQQQQNDLLERKKQRILMQSLRRQQEAEELKRRKEEELERKREEEYEKQEEKSRKKEEEKARREKILEEYRLRKMEEEVSKEGIQSTPPPKTAWEVHQREQVKRRPRSSPANGKPRPKTMHEDSSNYYYEGEPRLPRSDSQTSIGKYSASGQFGARRQTGLRQAGSKSSVADPWGSTTSLTSQRGSGIKYGRFGQRSVSSRNLPSLGGGGQQSSYGGQRHGGGGGGYGGNEYRFGGSAQSLIGLDSEPPAPAAIINRPRQLTLIPTKTAANTQVLHSPQQQQQLPTTTERGPTRPCPGSLPAQQLMMNRQGMLRRQAGGYDESDRGSEVGSVDYQGASQPRLYKQPCTKSNRQTLLNAVEYCVFPGAVNLEAKHRVLDEINRSDGKYFLIMFRDAGCQFRALYVITEDEAIVKLYGIGPKYIGDEMFDRFFKYNSGGKCFSPVHTKHLTVTIDAFTIHNALWQGKKATSARLARDL